MKKYSLLLKIINLTFNIYDEKFIIRKRKCNILILISEMNKKRYQTIDV